MDQELEAAGAFLGWRRRHALPPGTACYNCGTALLGPWCYRCGQLGEDFHRSAHHLIWEAFENFFHADGRLWRTLPDLLVRPGHLTRSYLDGHRAPQIPPMRLFLIVVLLVFLAGDLNGNLVSAPVKVDVPQSEISKFHVHVYPAWDNALSEWLRTHLGRAAAHPHALLAGMADWAHRLAIVTLPLAALMLALVFAFRRGVVLFDHLIFAMHSLAFAGLLATVMLCLHAAGLPAPSALFWLLPVHLFVHMRGVYGTGIAGTLVRMGVLFVLSTVAFTVLVLGLLLAGLAGLES